MKKGYGSAIVNKMIELNPECVSFSASVNHRNVACLNMIQKLGFNQVKYDKNYFKYEKNVRELNKECG